MMDAHSSSSRTSLRLPAPAKINLNLRVGPPTADGFHPLLTWMCTISLFDTLEFSPIGTKPPGSPAIELHCDDPSLPCDSTNLVVRCGQVLANTILEQRLVGSSIREVEDRTGGDGARLETCTREVFSVRGKEGNATFQNLCGVRIELHKRIPTGAGLGGGSSDGATAMRGLSRVWGVDLGADRLAALSARCGSDLPFFFHGPCSVCTGRGQIVCPTPASAARWGILILPAIAMPTPAVYRKFDEMRLGDAKSIQDVPDWQAWSQLPARELLPLLVNDLEAPAFALRPELGLLREFVESKLGCPVRMSGSGSSLFTLFDDKEATEASVSHIGPVPNAKIHVVQIAPEFLDL